MAYSKSADNLDSIIRYVLDKHDTTKTIKTISICGLRPANLQRKPEEINAMLTAEIKQFRKFTDDEKVMKPTRFTIVGDLKLLDGHP